MVVILVHWFIKKGFEELFIKTWEGMTIEQGHGLYREILTHADPTIGGIRLHTFCLESPHYETFVNIGIWESVETFERTVSKYINDPIEFEGRILVNIKDFEFKIRERIVLQFVSDRGVALPPAVMET